MYFLLGYLETGIIAPCSLLAKFFLLGSAYHLWYIPALIFVSLLTWSLHKLRLNWLLFPVGLLFALWGCAEHAYYGVFSSLSFIADWNAWPYWSWFTNFFVLSVSFFACGAGLYYGVKWWMNWNQGAVDLFLLVTAAMYFGEVFFLKLKDIPASITLTPGLYAIICGLIIFLFRHPCYGLKNTAGRCRVLAGITYYSHILILNGLMWMNRCWFSDCLTETLYFLLTVVLCAALGLLISAIRRRLHVPKRP